MKGILCIVYFFVVLTSFAQTELGIIELPESEVLYRGIENRIKVTVANMDNGKIWVSARGAQIQHDTGAVYIVRPIGRSDVSEIFVRCETCDTALIMGYKKFSVSNLPDPELYWGEDKESRHVNTDASTISAKYPKEIPLNVEFRIKDWTLYHGNEKLSGVGSSLNEADEFLQAIEPGGVLTIQASVIGPDSVVRRISGAWWIKE